MIFLLGCAWFDPQNPSAERLLQAGVPFVFATGYGDDLAMPKEFKRIKVVTKPYEDSDVAAALGQDR